MTEDSSSEESAPVDSSYDEMFTGTETAERDLEEISEEVAEQTGTPETELETESDAEGRPLSKALGDLVEREGLDIISEVGGQFQERQEAAQEHEKELIRGRMRYNGSLLVFFTIVVLGLVYTTTLSPVASLTFIAGLATGFGANTVINT